MGVSLTDFELAEFARRGITPDAIQSTVNEYRREGLDDNAIRGKVDKKLASFGASGNMTPAGAPSALEKKPGSSF